MRSSARADGSSSEKKSSYLGTIPHAKVFKSGLEKVIWTAVMVEKSIVVVVEGITLLITCQES